MNRLVLDNIEERINNIKVNNTLNLSGINSQVDISAEVDGPLEEVDDLVIKGIHCKANNIILGDNCRVTITGMHTSITGECDHKVNVLDLGLNSYIKIKTIDKKELGVDNGLDTSITKGDMAHCIEMFVTNSFIDFMHLLKENKNMSIYKRDINRVNSSIEIIRGGNELNIIEYIVRKSNIIDKRDKLLLNMARASGLNILTLNHFYEKIINNEFTEKEIEKLMYVTYSIALVTFKKHKVKLSSF